MQKKQEEDVCCSSVPIPMHGRQIPQQIEGIKKSLGDDVTIDYKFMDTKNVDTAENVHLFYKSLSYYLSQVPAYDVVIVGDDAAYNFVLVYRKIFGNTPIVFEGVNNVSKALAMDYNPNVTGIIENQTYGNTIALAKKIYPEAAHIVAIVDNTVTGLSARKEFYSYKDEFRIWSLVISMHQNFHRKI